MNLPVIGNCDGCGACCKEQVAPPGYLAIIHGGPDSWPDQEDIDRVANLPEGARASLEQYLANRILGSRSIQWPACIWLDPESLQCRWYDHRPNICRTAVKVGDACCRSWRKEFGVGEENPSAPGG